MFAEPPPPRNATVTLDNANSVRIQWQKPDDRVIKCLDHYLLQLYLIPADDCAALEDFKCLMQVYNQTMVQNYATMSTAGLNECAWYAVIVIPNHDSSTNQVERRRVSARFSIANAVGKCPQLSLTRSFLVNCVALTSLFICWPN